MVSGFFLLRDIGLLLGSIVIVAFAGEIADFFHGLKIPFFNKPYVRNYSLIILLSLLVIYFNKSLKLFLNAMQYCFESISNLIERMIPTGYLGTELIQMFVILLLSTIPWLLFSFLYWLSRKIHFTHFYTCVWLTWLVLIVSLQL